MHVTLCMKEEEKGACNYRRTSPPPPPLFCPCRHNSAAYTYGIAFRTFVLGVVFFFVSFFRISFAVLT